MIGERDRKPDEADGERCVVWNDDSQNKTHSTVNEIGRQGIGTECPEHPDSQSAYVASSRKKCQ